MDCLVFQFFFYVLGKVIGEGGLGFVDQVVGRQKDCEELCTRVSVVWVCVWTAIREGAYIYLDECVCVGIQGYYGGVGGIGGFFGKKRFCWGIDGYFVGFGFGREGEIFFCFKVFLSGIRFSYSVESGVFRWSFRQVGLVFLVFSWFE